MSPQSMRMTDGQSTLVIAVYDYSLVIAYHITLLCDLQ